MTTLAERVDQFHGYSVVLIGDVMLDQELAGAAERLSPDASVPILQATSRQNSPGGAACVAQCMQVMGGTVHLFGVVGDDREADILRELLEGSGCDTAGLVVDATRPTTVKQSLVGLAQHRHRQKMFRIDFETRDPIDEDVSAMLIEGLEGAMAGADVVCIEDYDKGVCTPAICRWAIQYCRERGIEVIVDPGAIDDYSRYHGATALTPNRSEAERATAVSTPLVASETHNRTMAHQLLTELDLDTIILTLDQQGALLQEKGCEARHVPTVARQVYDVTGAGDIVLAAVATGRANGLSWEDCVQLANAAAAREIQSFGTRPIPLAEVRQELLTSPRGGRSKVYSMDAISRALDVDRRAGKTIVLTNGCFDVLHAGHVSCLREARELGDILVVGVNCDHAVSAMKGEGRPIYPIQDRIEILGELQCIDYLVVFEEPTAHELIRATTPDIYVKGGDYSPEEIVEADLLVELGIPLRVLHHRPGLSTTGILARCSGAVEQLQ